MAVVQKNAISLLLNLLRLIPLSYAHVQMLRINCQLPFVNFLCSIITSSKDRQDKDWIVKIGVGRKDGLSHIQKVSKVP